MSARSAVARGVTAVLGLPPVAAFSARRWNHHLRVVAYHRVPDRQAFEAQVAHIAEAYQPVGEAQVRAALAGDAPLPERAVWLTFDDGDPTVVDEGLPVLARHGIPATIYVCPGLIEQGAAPWWRIVEVAGGRGRGAEIDGRELVGRQLIPALKRVPDAQRRAIVADLEAVAAPDLTDHEAVTVEGLERWVDAGCAVGNHTWDHPCLDHCDEVEQDAQISSAHEWLVRFQPDHRPTFAYPNGDRTDHAEATLEGLGYDVALLFDHALAAPAGDGLRTSRLRLDSEAPVGRARAVLSGAHSSLLGLRG
ncbi:MAG: polysaccharide deacetylase family protein [Acidimicrobiales bacterium]